MIPNRSTYQIYKRFRACLPKQVSDDIIFKVINNCKNRLIGFNESLLLLTDTKILITYGESYHYFDQGDNVINVFSSDNSMTWVFDSSTGEFLAT